MVWAPWLAEAVWASWGLKTCSILAIWLADAIGMAFNRFLSSLARSGWSCTLALPSLEGSGGGYLAVEVLVSIWHRDRLLLDQPDLGCRLGKSLAARRDRRRRSGPALPSVK